jgi:gas vesicle protein
MRSGRYESSDAVRTTATAITFFIIGAGAGALAALLLAPKSGKQLRKDIQRGYEDAKDAVNEWADETKDRVRDASESVRDAASRGIKVATDLAEDLRETARENIEPIRRAVKNN